MPTKNAEKWYLYVIRTVDDTLYTGVTTDVERRFVQHNARNSKGAKYFSSHPPAAIAFAAAIGTKSLAHKVEYWFKRLTRLQKETLVAAGEFMYDAQTGKIG